MPTTAAAGREAQAAAGVTPPTFEAKIREPVALESRLGRLTGPALATVLAVGMVGSIGVSNVQRYFVAQARHGASWNDHSTPESLIAGCRPQVLVKGGDWPVDRIVGAGGVLARGGKVVSIPFEHERSTTALLARIRKT